MKNLLLLIGLLVSTLTFAQTTILDFEDGGLTTDYQYFGSTLDGTLANRIDNPDPSGINTSDKVMEHVKPVDSEVWAGAFPTGLPLPVDVISNTQVCIKVWFNQPGNLALKLENSSTGGPNWIVEQDVTQTQTWVELCYDVTVASQEDPFQPAFGNTYDGAVVFFDFGESFSDADRTYYFDDLIVQGMGASEGDVTFSVDMNDVADPFTTVFVSGTFNDWSADANPLEDADGDGVWTGTVADIPVGVHEYKFQLDGWATSEEFTGGETCVISTGGFTNRSIAVSGDAILNPVCYNSCYECGGGVRININLGTNHIIVDGSGMFIAGGGNFGNPGDNPLSDPDGDGIYSISLEREVGFTSFYTFTNGACGDWACKENIAGQDCAHPDNFNDRMMGPVMDDLEINTCFEICTDNTDCGGSAPSDVTFQVDMNDYTDPFTQVYISGNFNSWSGEANPLDDADGDGIWEGTLSLLDGDYEYKFTLDNWSADEIFADGDPCTITDPSGAFVNRAITVAGEETVCFIWNTCTACETSTNDYEVDNSLFNLIPNLVTSYSIIEFGTEVNTEKLVKVYNSIGMLVTEMKVDAMTNESLLNTSDYSSGIYSVYVQVGNKIASKKLIKH